MSEFLYSKDYYNRNIKSLMKSLSDGRSRTRWVIYKNKIRYYEECLDKINKKERDTK